MRIVGAILAGGNASRLGGIAKGLLADAANTPWIGRLINELAKAGIPEVILSANMREQYARFGKTIVADLHADVGPLGGIEAVLQHLAGQCDAVLFVPCDLPNLSAAELRALVDAYAKRPPAAADPIVMAVTPENEHPLCAVVPAATRAAVSAAIAGGSYSVVRLWRRLGAVTVRFDNPESLVNINTPEELKRWQQSPASPEAIS
jgi:molybdopterin-guanine dinucleotide biosynthesis protein A